jgi:hypothetical protein
VNGATVNLLLDTGSFWTILDQRLKQKCKLQLQSTGHMRIAGSRGTWAYIYGARAKTIELDGIPIRLEFPLGVADLSDLGIGKQTASLDHVDGLLGHELLLQGRALIDFGGLSLWILPQQTEKK